MAERNARRARLLRMWALIVAIAAAACVLLAWPRHEAVVGGPGHASTPRGTTTPEPLRWRSVPSPLTSRTDAAVGWLGGRFYVVGGVPVCPANADCVAADRDGAWFDPASATWGRIADAPVALARTDGVAVGGELFFGVSVGTRRTEVLAYNPASDSWRTLPPLPASPQLISTGDMLLAEGECTRVGGAGGVRRYDPSADLWQELPDDPLDQTVCRDTVWADGRLLASASVEGGGLAEFDPATNAWTRLGEVAGAEGAPVAVGSRVVWLDVPAERIGARLGPVYDPATRSWQAVAVDLQPGPFHGDGAVTGDCVVYEGHLLDPSTFGTRAIPALPGGNTTGQTVAGGPGGLLVLAGVTASPARSAAFYLPVA